MNPISFARLFRMILSPGAKVDTAAIEGMGLLAVKIAQMYSVRPDLVGVEKGLELSRLLQTASNLSKDEFEQRWEELATVGLRHDLAKLRQPALASASLGQVHRGALKDGREIVVKIAKRDPQKAFLKDVKLLRRLLRTALLFYPRLERLADPIGALEAVERQTLREMNFLAEKTGADRLAALAAEEGSRLEHLRRLHFPKYLTEYSHERLLVSEFIEGQTLAELLRLGKMPYEALLDLFRVHGYFLFVRGEFHGDLHPGNVIWRDGHFWFLDNAVIETVPPAFAHALFNMLVMLGEGDLDRAAGQMIALSLKPIDAEQTNRFRSGFNFLYRDFAGKSVREASLTRQMMQTVKLAVNCGITFPSGAFPLIKSLMYLDGMVLTAAPDAVLLRDVAKFADDFTEQPALAEVLQAIQDS